MNGERAAYNLWEVSETRLIDRVRRSEGLTRPYCCCENTTRSARTRPCVSGRFGAPASAVRFPLPVPNSKFACEHAHMSTRVLAGLLSLLWCRRSRSHRKPWLSVPWLCALWRRDRELLHLDVLETWLVCSNARPLSLDSGLASRVMWAGAPGVGVHSSMPSRWTPDGHAVPKRTSCSLDHRQFWEKLRG
jgi:hypothetical protein